MTHLEVERAMGIEPTAQAWEAWVLPLYDARRLAIIAELTRAKVKRARPGLWRSRVEGKPVDSVAGLALR